MSTPRTLADIEREAADEAEAEAYWAEEAGADAAMEQAERQAWSNVYEYDPTADLDRQIEDERGVIQFEDAMDMALGRNREETGITP